MRGGAVQGYGFAVGASRVNSVGKPDEDWIFGSDCLTIVVTLGYGQYRGRGDVAEL